MTTTVTISSEPDPVEPADHSQELILGACVVLALIFFLLGLRWAKRRRHKHEGEHLVAEIAEPETLEDIDRDRRG